METEITEMESPEVSNQAADEAERRRNTNQVNFPSHEEVHWSTYWPLCKMIQENDWKGVEGFIGEHPEAVTEYISSLRTMFHYLIDNICDNDEGAACLIESLASKVDPITLEQKNCWGFTVLCICAEAGNTMASKIFVKYNPDLPNIVSDWGMLPVHHAARFGLKDIVQYLIQVTAEDKLKGSSGANLISYLIRSNLCDIAFDLLKQYPLIGRDHISSRIIVLETLAGEPQAFASGSQLGLLQRFIYNCTPVEKGNICFIEQTNKTRIASGDEENAIVRSKNYLTKSKSFGSLQLINTATFGSICQKLHGMFWNALMLFVPWTKVIHEQKVMHMQTVQILKMMCEGVVWNDLQIYNIAALRTAARFGISEIVNEIIMANNQSIYWLDENGHNVFQVAILHRQEKVFNLIYRIHFSKFMLSVADNKGNNMLHLVAATSQPSNKVAGAALQMQRELQWFKVVEDLVPQSGRRSKNSDDKTPRELFTTLHKDLVKEGEKWMKDTATSCTVVVALIITVVFAAAFTVPGGNNDNGLPNFLNDQAFLVFVISDALSLVSSTTSLLMFLGILTSRYAEDDFLISLPRKLIIGLVTLFFSVACMMVAFGATLYLVISHARKWVIIPISLLGCVPVTLFALLQFPLLLDMISSTYGSIFGPDK